MCNLRSYCNKTQSSVLKEESVDYSVYFTLNTSAQLLGKLVNQLRYGFLVSSRRNNTTSLDGRQKKSGKGRRVQKNIMFEKS